MSGTRNVRLLEVIEDRWAELGSCVGSDPDLWFSRRRGDVRRAKAVCAACPVQWDCEEAGRIEQFGIWGGLTPEERGFRGQ